MSILSTQVGRMTGVVSIVNRLHGGFNYHIPMFRFSPSSTPSSPSVRVPDSRACPAPFFLAPAAPALLRPAPDGAADGDNVSFLASVC